MMLKYFIILAVSTIVIYNVSAQDTHYWNLQYGTRSTLLGGAVIGSVSDMAATYYNPAALALFPAPEILLSGKVYQYSALSLNNGAGPGKDLTSSTIEAAPTLFAGSFTFDWLGDHTLSYSILTRQRMNFGIEGRRGGTRDTDLGEELVAGELIANQELSDLWVGLTWAVKLNSKIAIGVTPYLSIRDQKTRKHAYTEILDQVGNVSAAIITQQFEYKNYRLLAKAGFGANFDPLTLGLSITTPSLSLSGSGSSLVNLINTGESTNDETAFIANFQQDVTAQHHLPLAIGFGAGYRIGKHRLHFSAEWYDEVSHYNILDTENFIAQRSGEAFSNRVDSELKSITNYGIGAEFSISEHLNLFISYVTDFSAAVPDTRTNLTVSTWDIYHLSTGASFAIGRSEFTLGINYAFGSGKAKGPVNLPESDIKNTLVELFEDSDLDYKRLKFLIGFSIEI
jgi:long-subunit fatty acid transport protein